MNNLQLTELHPLIIQWAKDRNLLFEENAPKQRLKLIEECGELASAILKNDVKLQKDAIGDIFVVLVILAKQTGVEIEFLGYSKSFTSVEEKVSIILYDVLKWNEIDNAISYLQDICVSMNLDLNECCNIAWNEIKNRKGKTENGTFIKDENYDFPNIPGSEPTKH